ncbi:MULTISPECIES: PDZ domain-containing protein [unclassified Lentimonas]|uniref:PDZ domain-containing protein n=1 Tax=unclassified Lentimonas TaxID=2630993 RepID=UPI00132BB2AD|nr:MULTISPECIES: PDZ domain-containing protein [unclassified Lentimonas]CAA6677262.1 Unannotated [Lentimonas sp. CC4]CAA6686113.1 Unannotated [Lentimonas sp. CC6]CAA7074145.1 Unannotated [Lentimonas sp. CC4]CAA7171503.1 Unannotated [Lentimonas sp. CC21]CAA7181981.1 Unannotated [Lentimonas sp. CC8]
MLKFFPFAIVGFVCFMLGFGLRGFFSSPAETVVRVPGAREQAAMSVDVIEPLVELEEVELEIVEPATLEIEAASGAQLMKPSEAIFNCQQIQQRGRFTEELQNMVLAWIEDDSSLSDSEKEQLFNVVQISALQGGSIPQEVSLSQVIGQLSNPEIRNAWKASNTDSPMRAAIFSELAAAELAEHSPDDLLLATAGWTPWERAQYSDTLLTTMAQSDLNAAVEWGMANPESFGAGAIRELFTQYSRSDARGLEQALSDIQDPKLRAGAIEALAARRVMNTEVALEWADSLATPEEQALAHDVIYEMTPRGIGVSITSRDGFPEVANVVRSSNGLRRGDRIVGVIENGGEPIDTFGRSLEDVVEYIRGEPGTEVTVQVLRGNKSTDVTQVETVITREQLYFD